MSIAQSPGDDKVESQSPEKTEDAEKLQGFVWAHTERKSTQLGSPSLEVSHFPLGAFVSVHQVFLSVVGCARINYHHSRTPQTCLYTCP